MRGISPPAGGDLLCPWRQSRQNATGDAADGHFVPIGPLTPGPHYGGRVPVRFCNVSGAQNLSGFPQFNPAHWGLGIQKFQLLRFQNCAWLCRANAPGAYPGGSPKGLPYARLKPSYSCRRGGACPSRRPSEPSPAAELPRKELLRPLTFSSLSYTI